MSRPDIKKEFLKIINLLLCLYIPLLFQKTKTLQQIVLNPETNKFYSSVVEK